MATIENATTRKIALDISVYNIDIEWRDNKRRPVISSHEAIWCLWYMDSLYWDYQRRFDYVRERGCEQQTTALLEQDASYCNIRRRLFFLIKKNTYIELANCNVLDALTFKNLYGTPWNFIGKFFFRGRMRPFNIKTVSTEETILFLSANKE